ncbi:hypothetical protein [Alkalihalobacillus pseudalcaliphilus]|uniref:hypothetical protein n=1 Tax=Alkalihalobacillus pseudalcaliphilus TaxID=79884 RepID=UPI00064E1425|nr:hypothetical protein [Alkalihalobacillus pseudalcaliphilus]KMK75277.1 hypothetical protein AB990_17830 [Alkalihalobacillus pseudalcaliphilus]
MEHVVYFREKFFSRGITEILDKDNHKIGYLELKSGFRTRASILDENQREMMRGELKGFTSKWLMEDYQGQELGYVKQNYWSWNKKYHYNKAQDDQAYLFQAPVFSEAYQIQDGDGQVVGEVKRVSFFFSAPAYELTNRSLELSTEELILAITGVNALNRMYNAAVTSSSH